MILNVQPVTETQFKVMTNTEHTTSLDLYSISVHGSLNPDLDEHWYALRLQTVYI